MPVSHILIQDYAGVTVVTLTEASIIHTHVIEEIAKELYPLVDAQNKQKLIIDFSNVKLLASHTIGVLVTLHKKVAAIKGTLVFCAVRKEVMKIFQITGLDKQYSFFPDDAAALASFGVRVK
jgi:anti-anti-sigma factor